MSQNSMMVPNYPSTGNEASRYPCSLVFCSCHVSNFNSISSRLTSIRPELGDWSWGFLSSTAFLPPSAMNFTGCRSRNASGSKSLSSCVIVSWCGARVSDGTLSSGEFILWSAVSTLCLTWWSHCSEILTSKIWLQGICCLWAPCVELSSDRN